MFFYQCFVYELSLLNKKNMFTISSLLPFYFETLKNLEFEIFLLNLKKSGILNKKPVIFNSFNMFSNIFRLTQKFYTINKFFLSLSLNFFI